MSGWWDVFVRLVVILNAVLSPVNVALHRYDLAALNVSVVALWVALQAHGRGVTDA